MGAMVLASGFAERERASGAGAREPGDRCQGLKRANQPLRLRLRESMPGANAEAHQGSHRGQQGKGCEYG
jgi:hypothetical protein